MQPTTAYTVGEPQRVELGAAQIPALRLAPQPTVSATTVQPLPCVVFQHGYGADKYDLLQAAEVVAALGFIIILPDAWGHGERFVPTQPNWLNSISPDYFIDVVRHVTADLTDIVATLRDDPAIDAQRIILSGFSLGGIAAILATERDPTVAGVLTMAGAVSSTILKAPLGLGAVSEANAAWVEANDMEDPALAAQLAPRPTFLLHGRFDDRLPVAGSEQLFAAAQPAYAAYPDRLRLTLYDASHEITLPMLSDALDWLVEFGR